MSRATLNQASRSASISGLYKPDASIVQPVTLNDASLSLGARRIESHLSFPSRAGSPETASRIVSVPPKPCAHPRDASSSLPAEFLTAGSSPPGDDVQARFAPGPGAVQGPARCLLPAVPKKITPLMVRLLAAVNWNAKAGHSRAVGLTLLKEFPKRPAWLEPSSADESIESCGVRCGWRFPTPKALAGHCGTCS